MDSIKTQIPFAYYALPFCAPDMIEQSAENLGEVLSGDVIQNSNYEVCGPKNIHNLFCL